MPEARHRPSKCSRCWRREFRSRTRRSPTCTNTPGFWSPRLSAICEIRPLGKQYAERLAGLSGDRDPRTLDLLALAHAGARRLLAARSTPKRRRCRCCRPGRRRTCGRPGAQSSRVSIACVGHESAPELAGSPDPDAANAIEAGSGVSMHDPAVGRLRDAPVISDEAPLASRSIVVLTSTRLTGLGKTTLSNSFVSVPPLSKTCSCLPIPLAQLFENRSPAHNCTVIVASPGRVPDCPLSDALDMRSITGGGGSIV